MRTANKPYIPHIYVDYFNFLLNQIPTLHARMVKDKILWVEARYDVLEKYCFWPQKMSVLSI